MSVQLQVRKYQLSHFALICLTSSSTFRHGIHYQKSSWRNTVSWSSSCIQHAQLIIGIVWLHGYHDWLACNLRDTQERHTHTQGLPTIGSGMFVLSYNMYTLRIVIKVNIPVPWILWVCLSGASEVWMACLQFLQIWRRHWQLRKLLVFEDTFIGKWSMMYHCIGQL